MTAVGGDVRADGRHPASLWFDLVVSTKRAKVGFWVNYPFKEETLHPIYR